MACDFVLQVPAYRVIQKCSLRMTMQNAHCPFRRRTEQYVVKCLGLKLCSHQCVGVHIRVVNHILMIEGDACSESSVYCTYLISGN